MPDPFAPAPRAGHAYCLPPCPPPAVQVHTREDQYRQTRTAVHSQYPGQTRASPAVVVSLRPGVVDHKELHDAPDNQSHREQPAHNHCREPQQPPSSPRRTPRACQTSTPFAQSTRPLRRVRGRVTEALLASQAPSRGGHMNPCQQAPRQAQQAPSVTGFSDSSVEVSSAGDGVRTEAIFARDHQPGRKPAERPAFSPARADPVRGATAVRRPRS